MDRINFNFGPWQRVASAVNRQLDAIQKVHGRATHKPWLGPIDIKGGWIVALIILICVAVGANLLVRHSQLDKWADNPEISFIFGAPSFSTTDAPFFLGHARSILNEEGLYSYYEKMVYPNHVLVSEKSVGPTGLTVRPLLSVAIAYLSKSTLPSDLLVTATYLSFACIFLTGLMIVFCFGAAGYWLEGTVAALGGGLSSAFLARSSIGRIDTDQLNLGFLYLLCGLALCAAKARSLIASIVWFAVIALAAKTFMWWYDKPELIWLAAITLGWLMLCLRRNLVLALLLPLLLLEISSATHSNVAFSAYLDGDLKASNFIFPNTLKTITEVSSVGWDQVLRNIAGSVELGLLGLIGLLVFAVRHPIIAISFSPFLAFSLLSFVFGNRTIFYSAPIIWFGIAFLFTSTARLVSANLATSQTANNSSTAAPFLSASIMLLVAWANSPTDYTPRPTFPKQVLEGLASLNSLSEPTNSVVATWWDYGYASMFFNNLPTLHDGGSQTTSSTHFVATSLLDQDQPLSIGKLRFLTTEGHVGISKRPAVPELLAAFAKAEMRSSPDIYLVVTNQMSGWMGSISKLGNWDIETGKPVSLRNNPDGPKVDYRRLNCRMKDYPRSLNCQGVEIDLQRGLLGGRPLLIGWTHTKDGEILRRRDFDHDADHAVQIVQEGTRLTVYFLHRQLYESTFNKLYHQGLVEHPAISLHYDDYPHIRIYRIDGNPDG